MERDERYEVSSDGRIVIGQPVTLTGKERKAMIEKMFSINGWKYTILQEITSAHYHIKLENENLGITRTFHLYHGNVRKEDPERNREEKKIQLGTENDPRTHMDDALILGFYVYENKDSLSDTIIVAWPIEEEKNYPANPSLRVNMRTDIQVAKNTGYYVDKVTGKNLVVFRPEFIYHYIENYKNLQYSNVLTVHQGESVGVNASESDNQNERLITGCNVLLYGVPGSGKSWTIEHEYCKPGSIAERLVFHPDYTYSDFIGQILPAVAEDGQVSYKFTPGPFTNILREAYNNPGKEYILIIEEINRGNAPAIFGEVFQLLDRKVEIRDIDDDGYVNNLDQLKKPLETIDETKKKKVLDMKQKADKILNKVVEEIPKEYGKKQTIDYFLKWMDDNLTMDNEMMESSDSVSKMTEAFEKNYFEGCTSCVVNGKAIATGYSKVLARLCNKAGISAHIVLGNWKYSGSYTLVKVDFAGKQVYIDASGYKKDDLWNQRYISETLMARNLSVTDLFSEENGTK